MISLLSLAVLALQATGSVGCSSRAKGSKKNGPRSDSPLLTYRKGLLPGVLHASRDPAPGDPQKTSTSKAANLACDQFLLEKTAAAALYKAAGPASDAAPLSPPLLPHVNPAGLERFVNALSRRHPRAGRRTRSLRATDHARIRYAPDHDAEEVGRLARRTRIPIHGFVGRRGCSSGWMALGPSAYVCTHRFLPDTRPPRYVAQPVVPKGRITPGVYGYIRPGGAPAYASRGEAARRALTRRLPGGFFIRFGRFCRIKDRNYWKTTKGLYVPVNRIARHVPSKYHGYLLAESRLQLPVAIARRKGAGGRGIQVFHTPGKRTVVGRLARYTAVSVLGLHFARRRGRRTRYLRIGPCQWIQARDVRIAWPESPPPGVRQGERWIDIDLQNQILTAYQGHRPVFVTLISTGKKKHETRHGVFRVYWKVAQVDMSNEMGAADEYLAESVPWSMFFWKGQALHGAYWHDSFGRTRSHGCVNLSPRDARFLFNFSQPTLPGGWHLSWHGEKFPGTVVQVRRRRGEKPRILGYARKFAPRDQVIARDNAYLARVKAETVRMLRGDDEDDEQDEDTPSKKPPARQGLAPLPTMQPSPRRPVRRAVPPRARPIQRVRRPSRARRPARIRSRLAPIAPPAPPPPRRSR